MRPASPLAAALLVATLLAATVAGLAACGGGGGRPSGEPALLGLTTFQDAVVVIGQPIFVFNAPNQGLGQPTSQTLAGPGMPSAGPVFYLPDTSNHRVLGYDQVPFLSNIGANFVLGQPGLSFSFEGVGATALSRPLCARVHDGRLFVSDSGNHRVLIWHVAPRSNAAPANVAVGQPDRSTRNAGPGADQLSDPAGLCVAGDRLVVADRGNHRVLIWNSIPTSSGAPADVVLGQVAFGLGVANRGGAPGPNTLRDPFAVWTDGARVVVADRGNNRVLVWNTFPAVNGQPADFVLGQPNFDERVPRVGPAGLDHPSDMVSNGTQLFVADAGNHRVLVWNEFPRTPDALPDVVLGQADFEHTTPNDADQDGILDFISSARTFQSADDLLTVQIVDGALFVGDPGNHRLLVFHGD